MEVNAHVTQLSGKKVVLSVIRDITERRKAEEALEKSEERFRFTIDATNDGIWDWDIPTGAAFFSPRWYTMPGYAPDSMPVSTRPGDRSSIRRILALPKKQSGTTSRKKGRGIL